MQLRTYQVQRERQQQAFKRRKKPPTSTPASTPNPTRTQPSQDVHAQPIGVKGTQTFSTPKDTPKQDGEEVFVTDAPHPVTKVTTVARRTRARPAHPHRSPINTHVKTAKIEAKISCSHASTDDGIGHENSQVTQSSTETGSDATEVDSEACHLLRTQNRTLNLEINRLRKKISVLNKRERRFSKGDGRNVRATVDTSIKKKTKKQKRKKQTMRTKPVAKSTEASHQNTENRSPSVRTAPSKPKVDGARSHCKESDEHRARTTQNWAARQLLAVRKCVLAVMGSILKGNEALRHRLLDLQLGSATDITDPDIGGCTLALGIGTDKSVYGVHAERCV